LGPPSWHAQGPAGHGGTTPPPNLGSARPSPRNARRHHRARAASGDAVGPPWTRPHLRRAVGPALSGSVAVTLAEARRSNPVGLDKLQPLSTKRTILAMRWALVLVLVSTAAVQCSALLPGCPLTLYEGRPALRTYKARLQILTAIVLTLPCSSLIASWPSLSRLAVWLRLKLCLHRTPCHVPSLASLPGFLDGRKQKTITRRHGLATTPAPLAFATPAASRLVKLAFKTTAPSIRMTALRLA
jgi:hypothetical protein